MIKKTRALILLFFAFTSISFVNFNSAFAGKCDSCQKEGAASTCAGCAASKYCSKSCQSEHWAVHKGTCKLLKPFKKMKDSVMIAESPVSGRGLFANKDFEPGEPVAVYYGQESDFNQFKNFIMNFSNPYLLDPPHGDSIYRVGQNHDLPPHLSASMANDPFMTPEDLSHLLQINCKSPDFPSLTQVTRNYINKQRAFYTSKESFPPGIITTSLSENGLVFFQSERKIKKGSEIFFHYGFTYWANLSIRICERKGLAIEAMRIRNAISNTVTSLTGLVRESPESSKYFTAFLSNEDLAEVIDYMGDSTEIRIASLFLPLSYFRFFGLESSKLDRMLRDLHVKETLEEIAASPNSEFYDHERGVLTHPKSIELARALNRWKRSHGNTFEWAFRGYQSTKSFEDISSEMEEYLDLVEALTPKLL